MAKFIPSKSIPDPEDITPDPVDPPAASPSDRPEGSTWKWTSTPTDPVPTPDSGDQS